MSTTNISDIISAAIIDDEHSARTSLGSFLSKYCPQVNILGEAEDIISGEKLIRAQSPQLVFLDIEMPGGNAFDLLERFDHPTFEIIFITAYSDYAIQAFELSAAHYLLKPVSIDALIDAVEKVGKNLHNAHTLNRNRILLENMNRVQIQTQKIVLPLLDGFELVALRDVLYISALDNFSQVYLTNKTKITVCRKLKYFEGLLTNLGFFRIHRSHLVNKEYIKRYHKGKGGYVTLTTGEELDVAQSRKKSFLEGFGLS